MCQVCVTTVPRESTVLLLQGGARQPPGIKLPAHLTGSAPGWLFWGSTHGPVATTNLHNPLEE